jgi:hypothetical protein
MAIYEKYAARNPELYLHSTFILEIQLQYTVVSHPGLDACMRRRIYLVHLDSAFIVVGA